MLGQFNRFALIGKSGSEIESRHVIIGRATPERSRDYVSLRELGYFAG